MTSLSQRLSALHAERGHLVANYEAALQPSLDEARDLNDVEVEALGSVHERITGVDQQIERLSQAEALLARQAHPVPITIPGNRPGTAVTLAMPRQHPHITMQRRDDYKGAAFTRWAIAMCVAGQWNAAEYARQRWGDDELADLIRQANWFTRANTAPVVDGAGTVVQTDAQALVRLEQMGGEFIELLRPMLIVARLPSMRRLNFNAAGMLLIPRQSGGVAGGYVGEGNNIQVERLQFGQLQLTPSKLAVIVPMTNEILHRADPGLEQLVRDDMLQGTARTIDSIFYSALAPNPGPAGILNGIAENQGGRFNDVLTATSVVNIVTEALKNMILGLRLANVPMLAPVWIMHARTKEFLRLLRTTNTEIFAFKAEIDAGTLLGYPIIDSTNITVGAGPNFITTYALIDAAQLIWAEDMLPVIDASEHASIISATPPELPPTGSGPPTPNPSFQFSAFQADMVLMRIRMRHTWNRRYNEAISWAQVGGTMGPPNPP